ncbi:hypothetical protein MADA3029_740177 [Vibrio nigripulchritudo MADA3029]|nr:hypothetical protein VIBNIMADA3020_710110 [Vibrio nigripulchritudo MADA3020]CCN54252.1 hypothetical protein VIBNIMADA3021_510178 [Vibrio nigripulchritudo MADA3021]CCN61323.1 hypothetical protein MADA3029_740177 [Vibrio nigripulchritudo MADA3029]
MDMIEEEKQKEIFSKSEYKISHFKLSGVILLNKIRLRL